MRSYAFVEVWKIMIADDFEDSLERDIVEHFMHEFSGEKGQALRDGVVSLVCDPWLV